MRRIFHAVLLGWIGSTAMAASTDVANAVPQALLDQLAIPHDYQVTFEDPTGKVISYARFKAAMASRPFDVAKDTTRHRAVFKLESDATIAKNRSAQASPKALPIQGQPFPAFHASTLDGQTVSMASLQGKPFVASFFFAQCGPCIAETPVLSAFHRAHPEVRVVAFTFDDAATARDFVRTRQLNWPVVPEQGTLAEQAGVKVYPTIMLVDGEGTVVKAVHTDAIAPAGGALDLASLTAWATNVK